MIISKLHFSSYFPCFEEILVEKTRKLLRLMMVKKELAQCFDFDAEGAPIEMKNEHSYDLRKIEMT